MNKKLLVLYLLFPVMLKGQVNPGPRITALGLTGVALGDNWSIQSNQAGMAAITKVVVASAYENEFFNPDLSRQSAIFIVPVKNNVFGLSFQNYGFTAYSEQRATLAYARNFGGRVYVGIDFNYHQIKIQGYGSSQAYSVETGLQFKVNEKLVLGAHVANPSRSGYDTEANAVIPVSIEFGASAKFTENILFNTEVVKILNSATDVRMGVEYGLAGWIDIRGGVSANPFRQYAGVGFKTGKLHLDLAASSHPLLGYSPQVALGYGF